MSTLLLVAALLASPAAAHEEDPSVTLAGRPLAGPWPTRPAGVGASELGPSDPFLDPYDSVLFQGELPDPHIGFEASREENAVWSAWVRATVRRSPDGRFWGKVVFPTAGTGRLRLRAVGPNGPVSPAVTLYGWQVFLAGKPQPTPPPSGTPGAAEADTLGVIERNAWNAKPPKQPFATHVPNRFTQHHTAGRRPATLQESLAEVKFVQDFHQNGRGWNDVGYHFLVDPEGRIFRGRPVEAVGAHVLNDNAGNVGVSFMATHHPPHNHPVTAESLDASVRIGRWLEAKYEIKPDTYKGHRDRGQSDCLGDILYSQLETVRAAWRGAPSLGSRLSNWWQSFTARQITK